MLLHFFILLIHSIVQSLVAFISSLKKVPRFLALKSIYLVLTCCGHSLSFM